MGEFNGGFGFLLLDFFVDFLGVVFFLVLVVVVLFFFFFFGDFFFDSGGGVVIDSRYVWFLVRGGEVWL